jgi:hypothetical protein
MTLDISHLITQDNAEEGIWARVVILGKKYDFELKILGDDSDVVQKFHRAQVKKLRTNANKTEMDDETADTILGPTDEAVLVRMAGIRSLCFDEEHKEVVGYGAVALKSKEVEKELKDDKESFLFLIKKMPAIKDFVIKISGDRANFLSGKPNS